MKFRTEEDLLGTLEISEDVYYGIHTQRAINNFHISKAKIGDYPFFINGLVTTKKACAYANKEIGALAADKADMIIAACDEILGNIDKYAQHFPIDVFQGGAGTSTNMNVNEVIANVGLVSNGHAKGSYDILNPNGHVNKSQSTNDAYPTGFRVAIYHYMNHLLEKINLLTTQLDRKRAEFKKVLKMGRTQLQDAVPMSLGDEFSAWSTNMKKETTNLKRIRDMILPVNLGGTAIGTGVNAPNGFTKLSIGYLQKFTRASFVEAVCLIEATSDSSDYLMISAALKRTSVKLSKICNDLRLLSSGPRCGLNEINLPEVQAGSSIMPAKVNPVIPEVVNQVCFKIIGNDATVTIAAEAGQLQLNVMEPVIAQCIFESVELLSNAVVTLSEKCIAGITANAERTSEMVYNSVGLITFLNPFIGHNMGDKIGKEAIKAGKTIQELVLEKKLLTETELDSILSPENLMNPKYIATLQKK
jgi:aspartate ammonia-lyase